MSRMAGLGKWAVASRRRRRMLAAVVAVQVLFSTCAYGFRWISDSTPVTAASALERYRAASSATPPAKASPRASASRATASATPKPSTSASRTTKSRRPSPSPVLSAKGGHSLKAPEPGVYSWDTEGWEKVDDFPTREYPSESQRIVESSGRSWTNHHIFSSEHEEWFPLAISETGVRCSYFRMKLKVGPVTEDQTIEFATPVRFSVFPQKVGQTWEGSWEGDTSGTYTGKTLEHSTQRIGSEDVETWAVEIKMQMEGEVSGTVDVRLWISPKYRFTTKEIYKLDHRSGGHRYRTESTITLQSVTPQR